MSGGHSHGEKASHGSGGGGLGGAEVLAEVVPEAADLSDHTGFGPSAAEAGLTDVIGAFIPFVGPGKSGGKSGGGH